MKQRITAHVREMLTKVRADIRLSVERAIISAARAERTIDNLNARIDLLRARVSVKDAEIEAWRTRVEELFAENQEMRSAL